MVKLAETNKNLLPAFAMCASGLESVLFEELAGTRGIEFLSKSRGGVHFLASPEDIYRLNIWASIPSRILIQIGKTQINNSDELFEYALRIDYKQWFLDTNTFKVNVTSSGRMPKGISASYAALKFKDGICDYFRNQFKGHRPNVDTKKPDIIIFLHFKNSLLTVSIDTSGEPLFKRGWRESKGIAPIRENLVCALLSFTKWDFSKSLIDPMCGSGTFIIEGVKRAAQLPANYLPKKRRKFSCENFSSESPFNQVNYKIFIEEALNSWESKNHIRQNLPEIIGFDQDEDMIRYSILNAYNALPKYLANSIKWKATNFSEINFHNHGINPTGVIVSNPPFGLRMKLSENDKRFFFEDFGNNLKKNFAGWTAWILTEDKDLSSKIRLKPKNKYPVFNGDISCNWLSFDLFSGSLKNEQKN